MWKSSLRWIFNLALTLAVVTLWSCGQGYNSSYSDFEQYGSADDPNTQIGAARIVLKNRCVQCHTAYGTYTTNQARINSGLVIQGNWAASPLRNSLRNHGGSMPPSPMSELTSTELTTLETWVTNM